MVLALLHLLHFIVNTDEQVMKLGLVAAFSHIEAMDSLCQHSQQAFDVLVVTFLLMTSCKSTIYAH